MPSMRWPPPPEPAHRPSSPPVDLDQAVRPAPALREASAGGSCTSCCRGSRSSRRRPPAGLRLTIDAEEADRLDLSLELFGAFWRHPRLRGWDGLGLAVQAYPKRAYPVLAWLADLAPAPSAGCRSAGQRRLLGHRDQARPGMPAMTTIRCSPARSRPTSPTSPAPADARGRRSSTPAFATHNAQTARGHLGARRQRRRFEFQRLHGMGEALYATCMAEACRNRRCRVYAPVGSHKDLLALPRAAPARERRQHSFVNRLARRQGAARRADRRPRSGGAAACPRSPRSPQPAERHDLPAPEQPGMTAGDRPSRERLPRTSGNGPKPIARSSALVAGGGDAGRRGACRPYGAEVGEAGAEAEAATEAGLARRWPPQPVGTRRGGVARGRDLRGRVATCSRRHAARSSASACARPARPSRTPSPTFARRSTSCAITPAEARRQFAGPTTLPGPTGERNQLRLHGRGVFALSAPGTSRWRSSPGSSRPPLPPAMG